MPFLFHKEVLQFGLCFINDVMIWISKLEQKTEIEMKSMHRIGRKLMILFIGIVTMLNFNYENIQAEEQLGQAFFGTDTRYELMDVAFPEGMEELTVRTRFCIDSYVRRGDEIVDNYIWAIENKAWPAVYFSIRDRHLVLNINMEYEIVVIQNPQLELQKEIETVVTLSDSAINIYIDGEICSTWDVRNGIMKNCDVEAIESEYLPLYTTGWKKVLNGGITRIILAQAGEAESWENNRRSDMSVCCCELYDRELGIEEIKALPNMPVDKKKMKTDAAAQEIIEKRYMLGMSVAIVVLLMAAGIALLIKRRKTIA